MAEDSGWEAEAWAWGDSEGANLAVAKWVAEVAWWVTTAWLEAVTSDTQDNPRTAEVHILPPTLGGCFCTAVSTCHKPQTSRHCYNHILRWD